MMRAILNELQEYESCKKMDRKEVGIQQVKRGLTHQWASPLLVPKNQRSGDKWAIVMARNRAEG